jgi:tetratricopeptide (TPR) repeat protein
MGARGADEGKSQQPDWVTSDAQVFIDSGKVYLNSGDYGQAAERFMLAKDVASPRELSEAGYYLAAAYSLKGDIRRAFAELQHVRSTGQEAWASDYILLRAKLSLDTNAFKDSIDLLTAAQGELGQDARRAQLMHFLLALGYRGLGDIPRERQNLSEAVSLSPDSDVGKAAAEILKDL